MGSRICERDGDRSAPGGEGAFISYGTWGLIGLCCECESRLQWTALVHAGGKRGSRLACEVALN